jgi:hypothetical protein
LKTKWFNSIFIKILNFGIILILNLVIILIIDNDKCFKKFKSKEKTFIITIFNPIIYRKDIIELHIPVTVDYQIYNRYDQLIESETICIIP